MNAPVDGFLERLVIRPSGKGLLDGLTFAVKDLFDVAGTVTGCGNPTWAASHPPAVAHAVVVDLLLAAGAECLGKTITDEFAFSLVGENHFHGTPANPKAHERVPGGSSSGSASVVAAGFVDFALGTDTAGSVRVPAANCGLFGLRPTWGRISVAGVQPLAPSFDTVGFFARDAGFLDRVARVLLPVASVPPSIRRVLFLSEAWELADEEIGGMRSQVEQRLAGAGCEVASVALAELVRGPMGSDLFAWRDAFCGVQWPEIWSTYGAWLESVAPVVGPKIAANFAAVKRAGRSSLNASRERCIEARAGLATNLPAGTALCMPTTPCVAPRRGEVDYDRSGKGYLPRTLGLGALAGLCGLPQINLPLTTGKGIPAGVSLVGRADSDLALVESARMWVVP